MGQTLHGMLDGMHREDSLKADEETAARIRRSVTFHPSTAPPNEQYVAVSITKHEIVKFPGTPHVEYTLFVHQRGHPVKVLLRRFRQFESLSADVKKEALVASASMPELPKKRWLSGAIARRWINRWDEEFQYERRVRLQDYLRSLLRLPPLVHGSTALRLFLELEDDGVVVTEDASPLLDSLSLVPPLDAHINSLGLRRSLREPPATLPAAFHSPPPGPKLTLDERLRLLSLDDQQLPPSPPHLAPSSSTSAGKGFSPPKAPPPL